MGAVMCSQAGEWEMRPVEHIAEQIFPGPKMQVNFAQGSAQQRGLSYTLVSTSVSRGFLLEFVTLRI